MSIHRDRDAWRVYFRVDGKQRSRSFARKGDAELFDSDLKRKRALGHDLHRELQRSALTLDAFVREGFRAHAAVKLSKGARHKYRWALRNHLAELADEPLIALDVPRLVAHQEHLLEHGRSANTVRDVMARLSGILAVAVAHGHLQVNPVRGVPKVPAELAEDVRPLSPEQLERLIARLAGRDRIIAVLAGHLGLRPIEVRMATWDAFDGHTFTVGRARTKRTAARTRVIDVPKITALELKWWRRQAGRPTGRDPIIGEMTPNAMRLWNRRVLRPHAKAAARREDVVLYTLRHSHASACHYAGFTPPEAADRLGHGLPLHWATYAHVIQAMSGTRHDGLDDLLRVARVSAGVARELREPKAGGSS